MRCDSGAGFLLPRVSVGLFGSWCCDPPGVCVRSVMVFFGTSFISRRSIFLFWRMCRAGGIQCANPADPNEAVCAVQWYNREPPEQSTAAASVRKGGCQQDGPHDDATLSSWTTLDYSPHAGRQVINSSTSSPMPRENERASPPSTDFSTAVRSLLCVYMYRLCFSWGCRSTAR